MATVSSCADAAALNELQVGEGITWNKNLRKKGKLSLRGEHERLGRLDVP